MAKDAPKAAGWWAAAAAQGFASAQFNLGPCVNTNLLQYWSESLWLMRHEGICFYCGRGVEKDLSKAIAWFEKAASQDNSNSQFMLGLHYQHSNAALSRTYFERARAAVWSSQVTAMLLGVASLSVSEHFAKWHYLNFHHHIDSGFFDAGRQPSSSNREVIFTFELDPSLQQCVSEAQKLLAHISGTALLPCGSCTPESSFCDVISGRREAAHCRSL